MSQQQLHNKAPSTAAADQMIQSLAAQLSKKAQKTNHFKMPHQAKHQLVASSSLTEKRNLDAFATNSSVVLNKQPDYLAGREDPRSFDKQLTHQETKNHHSNSAEPAGQSQSQVLAPLGSSHGFLAKNLTTMKSSSVPNAADKQGNGKQTNAILKKTSKRTTRSDLQKQQSSHEPSPPNASTNCSSSGPAQVSKKTDEVNVHMADISKQFKNEAVLQQQKTAGNKVHKTRQKLKVKVDKKDDNMFNHDESLNSSGQCGIAREKILQSQKSSPTLRKQPTLSHRQSENVLNSGNKEALPARTFDESLEDEIIRLIENHQRERLQEDPMRELEEALMDRTTASLNRRQKPFQQGKNSQGATQGFDDLASISPTFIHIDFSRENPLQTISQAQAERFQELAQIKMEQLNLAANCRDSNAVQSFVSVASNQDQRKFIEREENVSNSSSDHDQGSSALKRRKRVKQRTDVNKTQYRERLQTDHLPRKARRLNHQSELMTNSSLVNEKERSNMLGVRRKSQVDTKAKMNVLTRHIKDQQLHEKFADDSQADARNYDLNETQNIEEESMQEGAHSDIPLTGGVRIYNEKDYSLHHKQTNKYNFRVKAQDQANSDDTLTDEDVAMQYHQGEQVKSQRQRRSERHVGGDQEDQCFSNGIGKSIHVDETNDDNKLSACRTSTEQQKRKAILSRMRAQQQMQDEMNDDADLRGMVNEFEYTHDKLHERKRTVKFHQKRREMRAKVENFVKSSVIDDQIDDEKTTPNQISNTFKREKSGGGLLPPLIHNPDLIQDVHNRTMATCEDIMQNEEPDQLANERCPATDSSEQFSSNLMAETSVRQIRKERLCTSSNQLTSKFEIKQKQQRSNMNTPDNNEKIARNRAETFGKSANETSSFQDNKFKSPQATYKNQASNKKQRHQENINSICTKNESDAHTAQGADTCHRTFSVRNQRLSKRKQGLAQQLARNDEAEQVNEINQRTQQLFGNTPQIQQQQLNQNNRCISDQLIHESTNQIKSKSQLAEICQYASQQTDAYLYQLSSIYLRLLPPPVYMKTKIADKASRLARGKQYHFGQTLHKLIGLTNTLNVCQMQYMSQLQMQYRLMQNASSFSMSGNPFSVHSQQMFANDQHDDEAQPNEVKQSQEQDREMEEEQVKTEQMKKESLNATLKRLLGPQDGWSSRPVHQDFETMKDTNDVHGGCQ